MNPDASRRARRLALWTASGAWVGLVLAVYYRAAWRLSWAALSGLEPPAAPASTLPTVVVAIPFAVLLAAYSVHRVWRTRRRGAPWAAGAWVLCLAALSAIAVAAGRGVAAHPALPYAGEAARRALMAAVGCGLVVASGWALGALALRVARWHGTDGRERLLYQLTVGLGAVSFLSLALAAAGVYRPAVVAPMVGVLAAAGAATAWMRRPSALRLGSLPEGSDLAWAAIAALAVGLALIAALAPEIEYDALWYHLWLPRTWLTHGHPVDDLTEYISLYPLTWELLYGDALAIGGPVAAKLLHFACLPLAALATWQLTHRFFRPVSPWLAVVLFVTVPTVTWEAGTAYIDLAVALFVTLGIHALLNFAERRDEGWLRAAALTLGLGVAIKHLGLVVVAIAATGLFVQLARRNRDLLRSLRAPLMLVLVALALASPWYWRAWAASGNPFFPELFKVLGAWPADRWDAISERGLDLFKARFGFPRTPLSLALLPWNVTEHAAAFGGCLGPVFLVALPWIVARLPRRSATRWLILIVGGYVAVWASPVSSFQFRFLVPILPAASVLAAVGLARLFAGLRAANARRGAQAVLGVMLLLNLPPFIRLHEGDRVGWSGWLTHVPRAVPLSVVVGRQSEDEYLRQQVPSYGAWRHLADAAPATAQVLDVGGGDNFYATRARVPMDATVARGLWGAGDDAARTALDAIGRLGLTHVLVEKSWLRRAADEGLVVVSDRFRHDHLQLDYEDPQALVYRVLPPKSSATLRAFRPS